MKALQVIIGIILLLPGLCSVMYALGTIPQIVGYLVYPDKFADTPGSLLLLIPLWLGGFLLGWLGWKLIS